jgi:RNA polymerase sigma factor (sigma-70 family)
VEALVDEAEAVACCRRLRPRLVGMLSLLCGDAGVAEELAQESLARVWAHWPKLRELEQQAIAAWAYRVAVNLATSWVRRRIAERRAVARLAGNLLPAVAPADLAEAVAIRRQVAALPGRQRTALVLRYYADLPVEQVADLMGCAPGTVKSLTSKAIGSLRSRLAAPVALEVPDGS